MWGNQCRTDSLWLPTDLTLYLKPQLLHNPARNNTVTQKANLLSQQQIFPAAVPSTNNVPVIRNYFRTEKKAFIRPQYAVEVLKQVIKWLSVVNMKIKVHISDKTVVHNNVSAEKLLFPIWHHIWRKTLSFRGQKLNLQLNHTHTHTKLNPLGPAKADMGLGKNCSSYKHLKVPSWVMDQV